jgi:hypothetical protein
VIIEKEVEAEVEQKVIAERVAIEKVVAEQRVAKEDTTKVAEAEQQNKDEEAINNNTTPMDIDILKI